MITIGVKFGPGDHDWANTYILVWNSNERSVAAYIALLRGLYADPAMDMSFFQNCYTNDEFKQHFSSAMNSYIKSFTVVRNGEWNNIDSLILNDGTVVQLN